MKHEVKRIIVAPTPEMESRWRAAMEQEMASKTENIALAKAAISRLDKARAEIARAAQDTTTTISHAAICDLGTLSEANPHLDALIHMAEHLGKKLVVAIQD
jgi:hypothetical protein